MYNCGTYRQVLQNGVEISNGASIRVQGKSLDANGQCTDGFSDHYVASRERALTCPSYTVLQNGLCVPIPSQVNPEKNNRAVCSADENAPALNVGNPIHAGLGYKRQTEVDFLGAGSTPLRFQRYYTSGTHWEAAGIGAHWRHFYARRLAVSISATFQSAALYRPDGDVWRFIRHPDGTWSGDSDIPTRLIELTDAAGIPTGWRVETLDGTLEEYNPAGQLIRLDERPGDNPHRLSYDAAQRLVSVVDRHGREMRFAYNPVDQIESITVSAIGTFYFDYDASGNLVAVTFPDATPTDRGDNPVKRYHYDDPRFAHALTGLTDERGIRVASWTYDTQGRAVSSEHAGGADRTTLSYNADGTTTVTNALGKSATHHFTVINGVQRLTRIDGQPSVHCAAASQAYGYDNNGFVVSRTDWNGVVTTYTRDAQGRELSRTEAAATPQARTVATDWHPAWSLPARIVEPKKTTLFSYDTRGRLLTRQAIDHTEATSPARTVTWTYDSDGALVAVDGSRTDRADLSRIEYDSTGLPARLTNALQQATQWSQYDGFGSPGRRLDPNGVVTDFGYDPRGRLLTHTVHTAQGDRLTAFDYDAAGQLRRMTLPSGEFLAYHYDAARRLIAVSNPLGDRIDYTLDAAGNRLQEAVHDSSGTLVRTHRQVFDELSRPIQSLGAGNQLTDFAYDLNGNLISINDPLRRLTQHTYDTLNRLVHTLDAANGVTRYTYDAQDQLTAVTDPRGNTTTYTVNGFGEVTEQRSPDSGVTPFRYDSAGNRIEQTDARGVLTQYDYDALNRLVAKRFPATPEQNVTYSYDDTANGNFGIGRLTRLHHADGTTLTWRYDERGNLIEDTRTINGRTYTTRYAYDLANRLVQLSYPSGRLVHFTRDSLGRITALATQATAASPMQMVATNLSYQPFGPASGLTFGNGVRSTHAFDLDGRLTALTSAGATATVSDWAIHYDAVGNITTLLQRVNSAHNQSFTYDALDRLLNATGGDYGQLTHTYDALGNRLTRDRVHNGTARDETYQYDSASNRLQALDQLENTTLTTRVFQHDPAGNRRDDGRFQYQHDAANRLVRAFNANTDITYRVNALGQRDVKRGTAQTIDYLALAAGQDALALQHRNQAAQWRDQATTARTQADQLDAQAQALLDQIPALLAQAEQLRLQAAAPQPKIDRLQKRIDRLNADIAKLRSQIVDPPLTDRDAKKNARLRKRIAGIEERRNKIQQKLDPILAEQANLLAQADALTAQANQLQTEATVLQAQATQLRANATQYDAHAQQEDTLALQAETQAAEYRRLAQDNPPAEPVETHFVYNTTGQLIYEHDIHTGKTVEYLYLDATPVAFLRDEQLYFIHTDHLGTPRVVTDSTQRSVWEWYSTPFGVNAANEDPDGDGTKVTLNLRFPGQYFDQETGLHYNYYRTYDPSTGRYISSDPIGLDGGLNTYTYVSNNPLDFIDPLGLVEILVKDGIVFDAKPGVGGGQTEHARAGAGGQFHFQLKRGSEIGPRIGTDTFEPLTPEDEKLFKGKFKDICKNLSLEEKRLLKRSTRDVFFGDIDKAKRRLTRFKFGAFGVLMSNSFEETCDKDVLDELRDVCE